MFLNSISSVSFRIYINRVGWELLTVVKKPIDVIKVVENNYPALIVVHDFDIDADTEVFVINSLESFIDFKENLLNSTQNTPKIRKISQNTPKKL